MSDPTNSSATKSLRAATDPDEMVGQVIDERYRLKRFISQGGMGAVFEAEHVTIQKPIAVKVLHPRMAQVPELVQRFEREAFAIGRIDHPNCIQVSDFGKLEDGALFLVMEYLDGESLADRIDDHGPMGPVQALGILRHILRGLAHIHRADIVHRDIKPENIMLVSGEDDDDFAKILDFGIAKLLGDARRPDDSNLTQAGIAFGTPTYMSPEQTLGETVDGRSDLYQATLLFYEMLASKPPFKSDDKIELMAMHASRPPPAVTEFNPAAEIPEVVQALIDRGLAKKPDDRFQSADQYLEAVAEALAELDSQPMAPPKPRPATTRPADLRATTSSPITATEALPLPHRRNVRVFAAIGLAFLAVGLLLLYLAARDDASDSTAMAPDAGLPSPRSASSLAAEALERGKPGEAIAVLTADGVDISEDAQGQLMLGHAQAARNRTKETIAAYRNAIALDESLRTDSALVANLKVLAKDKRWFDEAATMLIEDLDDKQTRGMVLSKAVTKGDGAWRHLALKLADKLGFIDEVDLRTVYELDLAEGRRCVNRKAAVAKLRALGDPKAIPALKKAAKRRGTRGRWRGRRINGCLADDARKAIQYLQTVDNKNE